MRKILVVASCLVLSVGFAIQAGTHLQVGAEAPAVKGVLTDGKSFDSASASASKPTFVVFWKERCPHNKPASAAFNVLAKHYGGKVNFIGVVSATDEGAKAWTKQFETTYPLLADPEKAMIRSYGLRKSIVSYQIGSDGKVAGVFPGYGTNEIAALNTAMATATKSSPANLENIKLPGGLTWG